MRACFRPPSLAPPHESESHGHVWQFGTEYALLIMQGYMECDMPEAAHHNVYRSLLSSFSLQVKSYSAVKRCKLLLFFTQLKVYLDEGELYFMKSIQASASTL
jgi:hypothetical protein